MFKVSQIISSSKTQMAVKKNRYIDQSTKTLLEALDMKL